MGLFLNIAGWAVRLVILAVVVGGMAGCTMLGLNYASLDTAGKTEAWPQIEGPTAKALVRNGSNWVDELEDNVFGPFPIGINSRVIEHRVVDPAFANGKGQLEEYTIQMGEEPNAVLFNLAVVYPVGQQNTPLIVYQSFCGNRSAFQTTDLSEPLTPGGVDVCGGVDPGFSGTVISKVFGEYITSPPFEQILDRGYTLAHFYASEIVPDSKDTAKAALSAFPAGEHGQPTGAVAAWAAGFSSAIDVLKTDPRINASQVTAMGHSRHAKSALVAGAYDPEIEVVIAHQAGTGGAALSRFKKGESVKSITKDYPHWFDPAYRRFDADGPFTTPVDMHVLIALNAPRHVLLGNGRRDVWSDPNGTWRAAIGADASFEAAGTQGLDQDGMRDRNLSASLSFYMRDGGHGIVQEDWDTFLTYMDNAFGRTAAE